MRYLLSAKLAVVGLVLCQSLAAEVSCSKAAPDASRVAVAGGSITEVVYFLGEQERLIAVDRTSNYPDAALELPQIGYVRALSTEGLLSLKPTLVLGESDMGPPEVISQLADTGIDTVKVEEAHNAAGIVAKVRCVAQVLGVDESTLKAAEAELSQSVARLDSVSVTDRSPTAAVILTFQQGSAIVAGAGTSGHGVLQMAGFQNVFEETDGWKPLSAESLIKANPDYLIITARGVRTAGGLDKIYENPGVRLTTAGQKRQLIEVDGMTLLGFGPRTLDAAVTLSEHTKGR